MRPRSLAACLLLWLCLFATLLSAQPREADANASRARLLFERGVLLMENADWAAALVQFGESFRLRPTQVALFDIGLCQKELHRYPAAIDTFERLLRDFATGSPDRLALARTQLESLRALVGSIRIEVDVPDAEVLVDGVVVGTSPLAGAVRVAVGDHSVQARKEGHESAEQRVALVAGSTPVVSLVLAPRPAPPPQAPAPERRPRPAPVPVRTTGPSAAWFWSTAILAGVATLTTAALGTAVVATDADYRASDPRLEADRQDGQRLVLLTDVSLGIAVVAAVSALLLYTQTDFTGRADAEAATTPRLRLAWNGLEGAF